MSDPTPTPFFPLTIPVNSQIRSTILDGITYYSLIDIIAVFSSSKSNPAAHWWDIKKSLEYRETSLDILQMRLACRDGKLRLTDVGTEQTCKIVLEFLGNTFRKHPGYELEAKHLRPLVENKLLSDGYTVTKDFQLPSGKKVDLIAQSNKQTLLIECKTSLCKSRFFAAVGQVLCYRAEYQCVSRPVLATFSGCVDHYSYQCAKNLGIQIITVENELMFTVSFNLKDNADYTTKTSKRRGIGIPTNLPPLDENTP